MMNPPLYQVITFTHDAVLGSIHAELALNGECDIFKGHFPQTPVLPGVSMLQIIKDLIEQSSKSNWQLQKASNIKYLSLVQPDGEHLFFEITVKSAPEDMLLVNSILKKGAIICMKFSGTYIKKSI